MQAGCLRNAEPKFKSSFLRYIPSLFFEQAYVRGELRITNIKFDRRWQNIMKALAETKANHSGVLFQQVYPEEHKTPPATR